MGTIYSSQQPSSDIVRTIAIQAAERGREWIQRREEKKRIEALAISIEERQERILNSPEKIDDSF